MHFLCRYIIYVSFSTVYSGHITIFCLCLSVCQSITLIVSSILLQPLEEFWNDCTNAKHLDTMLSECDTATTVQGQGHTWPECSFCCISCLPRTSPSFYGISKQLDTNIHFIDITCGAHGTVTLVQGQGHTSNWGHVTLFTCHFSILLPFLYSCQISFVGRQSRNKLTQIMWLLHLINFTIGSPTKVRDGISDRKCQHFVILLW